MTTQKTFKRRVRARAAKTGESYTAARAQLTRHPEPASATNPEPEPEPDARALAGMSDESIVRGTGRPIAEWLSAIDAWDGTSHAHAEIARWLMDEHGVGGWWAQSLTVAYERARGRRAVHQRGTTFSVSATRTIDVPPEAAWTLVTDEARREAWLPDAPMSVRTSTRGRTARYDWPNPPSRVIFDVSAKGSDRSVVAVAHERLPDAGIAARMKQHWRERLVALRELASR